jgi:hypothetical protein
MRKQSWIKKIVFGALLVVGLAAFSSKASAGPCCSQCDDSWTICYNNCTANGTDSATCSDTCDTATASCYRICYECGFNAGAQNTVRGRGSE